MKLLIADDDENWIATTKEWAIEAHSGAAFQTLSFQQPDELLAELESTPSSAIGPIVVLLDLDFRHASGIDALAKLKNHANASIRNIPVIMYSRSNSPIEIEKCYAANANSYVHKGAPTQQKEIFQDTLSFWINRARIPGGTNA